MTTYIESVERFATGYEYTLTDPPPSGGYDVWLNGQRIATRVEEARYYYQTTSNTPPPIEIIAGYEDTPSKYASTRARLQWQHTGATHYIIERSLNNVTFSQIGVVAANGNIFHNFEADTNEGAVYYRVHSAVDNLGVFRKTSYPIPCVVVQAFVPPPPIVRITATGGEALVQELKGINYVDSTLV